MLDVSTGKESKMQYNSTFFLSQWEENELFLFRWSARLMPLRNCPGLWGHPHAFLATWYYHLKPQKWTSLVVQWLRICLPMHRTWGWALVREDPTCRGATKPMRHNYWACALEPMSHNYWAHVLQLLKPARLEPALRNKRGHHNEKPALQRRVAPTCHN